MHQGARIHRRCGVEFIEGGAVPAEIVTNGFLNLGFVEHSLLTMILSKKFG
ncbi:hypothetical protein [Agrobacterium sp. V1]|uniref:hypothetical protein n=1 Tax=Agrobacterium sp. V1 TaxID=3061957 RepID=UPI0026741620|nr:hypothetical protein [Agrobacterium sp. V1]MDO3445252.1 hypothetical protein [Agrobacterium sp. V1]